MTKPFFILAPMDDVTDTVFRQIVASCATPDLFFTEFVNVDGLQSPGRPALMPKIARKGENHPVVAQIWGKKPENFGKTASELVDMGFAGVDINFGCPVRTVVKNNCCSAMILPENRDCAVEIINAVKTAVDGRVPVSVKTRLGFKEIDLSWIELLLKQKLNMLSIHARTVKEMSKTPPHWEVFDQIIALRDKLSPGTLIVGNGDILTRQDGLKLAKKYNLDGIMIGRGIFADPYIFTGSKSPWAKMSKQQKLELFQRHVKLFAKTWKNGERRFETLKKFVKIYVNGFDDASELRTKVMLTNGPEELITLITAVINADTATNAVD